MESGNISPSVLIHFTQCDVPLVTHVLATVRMSFCSKAESHSIVWMNHVVLLRSSVHRQLGCSHLWAAWTTLLRTWVCESLFQSLLL